MRSYQWWKRQKKRVQKKYTLLCGRYFSPKELKEWYKCWTGRKRGRRMKIVIDVPEEVYKSIQDNDYCGISNADMYNAVKNGTPLPKNHGRLIECERLQESFRRNVVDVVGYENYKHLFDIAPTIIEAESEEEE